MNAKHRATSILWALVVAGLLAVAGAVRADERPVYERELWNTTRATGADVFTSSLTLGAAGPAGTKVILYRVTIGIDATAGADSIVYARYTRTSDRTSLLDATTNEGQAANLALNSATALTAGNLYVFDLPATKGASLNFRVGTQTVFRWFLVQRIQESQ